MVSLSLFYFSKIKIKDPTNGFRMFSKGENVIGESTCEYHWTTAKLNINWKDSDLTLTNSQTNKVDNINEGIIEKI